MGPGDKFSEDPTGSKLYVKTPNGLIQVAERRSDPEKMKKEEKLALGIAWIVSTIAFLAVFQYCLSNINNFLIDPGTRTAVPWNQMVRVEKALVVMLSTVYAIFAGAVAWLITAVGITFCYSIKKVNFKALDQALKNQK